MIGRGKGGRVMAAGACQQDCPTGRWTEACPEHASLVEKMLRPRQPQLLVSNWPFDNRPVGGLGLRVSVVKRSGIFLLPIDVNSL